MKISQSKVRVEPNKAISTEDSNLKSGTTPKPAAQKSTYSIPSHKPKAINLTKTLAKTSSTKAKSAADSFLDCSETSVALKQVLAKAKTELKLIQKMKDDTLLYQQKVAAQARSEAHHLTLSARVVTRQEIEAIVRQANQEIQQVLADIRITRITAQEELATLRRYVEAAKLNGLSISFKDILTKSAEPEKDKKQEPLKPKLF